MKKAPEDEPEPTLVYGKLFAHRRALFFLFMNPIYNIANIAF